MKKETVYEFGDRTGLKQAIETHLEYGDDIVRLALISFKQHVGDLVRQLQELETEDFHTEEDWIRKEDVLNIFKK